MMRLKFTVILIFLFNTLYSQQSLKEKYPIKKNMDIGLYKTMLSVLNEANICINDSNTYWFDLPIYYNNRFVAYATLANDTISEKYFFEAFENNPEDICNFINHPPKRLYKANPYLFSNLSRKRIFYDSCCNEFYNSLDSNLIKKLKKIEENDQLYRGNNENHQTQNYWTKQIKLDSLNLIEINKIFDHYGYPGRNLVGKDNENVMFLVIQHSDLKTMEKYLPYLKAAIKKHNLHPKYYAYLLDRINMIKGIPQVFGTQVVQLKNGDYKLYEMKSFYKIDSLRASFGLGKLKDYLQQFNIYDINK